MKCLSHILLSILLPLGLMAQQLPEERTSLSSERRPDGTIEISAEKHYPGTQTAVITFKKLTNCHAPRSEEVLIRQSGVVRTLRPADPDKTIEYSYSYRIFDSHLNPKFDKHFFYRLPVSEQNSVRVYPGQLATDIYLPGSKNEKKTTYISYHFYCERGDTVFATRRGVVVEIEHPEARRQGEELAYTNEHTSLIVEHPDGTRAYYGQVEQLMVQVGDTVYPDTPLALVSTFDHKTYKFYLHIGYWGSVRETTSNEYAYYYIDPIFSTTVGKLRLTRGGTYTPRVDDELIEAEMSKRERKQRKR